jgi:ABC-2 type transport system permease protein
MKYIFINIWRVLVRELKMMFARPLYLSASVVVMLLSTFFFLTLMKGGTAEKMPVAVVDLDQTSISRRLIHEMQATPSVDIQLITNSYPEARLTMQQGKIYGIFVIPEGFYSDLVAFKRPQMDFYVTNAYTVGGNRLQADADDGQPHIRCVPARGAAQERTDGRCDHAPDPTACHRGTHGRQSVGELLGLSGKHDPARYLGPDLPDADDLCHRF